MSPKATHILDWFHLTMKLTVLGQYGKGLVQCETALGEAICDQIERLKWSLWHGQVDKALGKIDELETSIEPFNETYARFPRLVKASSALRTYIVQELRSGSYPLQGWQGCLRTLEDETPLELPPGASLSKTLTFHNQIGDET
jgi:hypothetical protein